MAKEMLSESEIYENAIAISNQIKRIYYKAMELSGTDEFKSIDFVDNLAWFKDMKFIDFLSNMGRFVKVNSMLSRNW